MDRVRVSLGELEACLNEAKLESGEWDEDHVYGEGEPPEETEAD